MDKILSYIPDSVLRFKVNTDKRIAIQSSNNLAPVIDLKFPVSEPYARLMGRWIIECRKNTILMRETDSRVRDDCIVLSFQQPEIDVEVKYSGAEGSRTSKLKNVDRVDVYPREVGKIKIQIREQSADSGGTSDEDENIPVENITGQDPSAENTSEQDPSAANIPQDNTASAGERTGTADASLIRQLRKDLERERAAAKHLQDILAVRLDDVLQTLTRDKQLLSSENQSKQQALETLDAEIESLRKASQDTDAQIAEANRAIEDVHAKIRSGKDELNGLQEQLSELNVQREVVELDCDAAKEQLEELKTHVSLDAETVALLEEGDKLKHGTVSKTLEEMESEIEKAEKRIAFILKFRSKFNQIVEDAIFSGDGTISAGEEAGGIADGVGSTTPSENT